MHRTPLRRRRTLVAAWLPLAALAVVILTLPDITPADHRSTTVEAGEPVGASALRVRIDAESGSLVHDPASSAALKAPELQHMLSRSDDGMVEESLPGGGVRVDLRGRFQSASVAHLGQDGRVHLRCSDQLHEAESHLAGCQHAPTPQSQWEVK